MRLPALPERPRRALALLGALLLALALVALAAHWAEQRETRQRRAALRAALDMHTLWLRGVTRQYAALPVLVGQQPEIATLLAQPQDPARQERVNRYLEAISDRAGAMALYVLDARGQALAASNWRSPETFVGQNYARRPYFAEAMAGRSSLFYGVGMTTGRPGLFLAEPLRQGGRVLGVVAVKVALDSLSASWARSPDPVLVRDRRGVSFLASYPEWRYRLSRPLTSEEQASLHESLAYGPDRQLPPLRWQAGPAAEPGEYLLTTEVGGRARTFLAQDRSLPEFGWTLTVLADRDEILQTRRDTAAMAALALALAGMAALYWRLRERRFQEQRQARRELEQRVQDRTRELQEAHAFRHAMEDSLLVGMRARDLSGAIIYVNRALCRMTGYRADELLGRRPPYPYWHPDDLAKHWSDSDAALNGQAEPSGFESRVRHKDGHDVITRVYTAPLIDADGVQRGWMSSVVDITEQKQAEAREQARQAQLQRTARLASLGEMASSLAHELNQPLMALSNFAAAAKALAQGGPPGMLVASLDDIQAQARRASEIVRRIRGMVRPGRGVTEQFELQDLVHTVLGWLQPELRARQVSVAVDLPADLPRASADRVLAEQLLLNLLLNALQAQDGQPAGRRWIGVEAAAADGRLRVGVSDQGPGIAPEHAEHLFDPFFTTKPDGLGLGLKICRTIAESQGGHLSWQPRAEGGVRFEFTLPACP